MFEIGHSLRLAVLIIPCLIASCRKDRDPSTGTSSLDNALSCAEAFRRPTLEGLDATDSCSIPAIPIDSMPPQLDGTAACALLRVSIGFLSQGMDTSDNASPRFKGARARIAEWRFRTTDEKSALPYWTVEFQWPDSTHTTVVYVYAGGRVEAARFASPHLRRP